MDESALQKRLDAILLLLVVNVLLLLGIGFEYATETTVGMLVLALLIGYGHVKSNRKSS